MLEVGGQHADRAEHARQRRHHHAADAEIARHVERVDAAVAADGDQRQVARVAPALHRHGADRARHGRVGDGADAVRRILQRQAERLGHVRQDRPLAQAPVDGQPAAGQRARIDEAQHDVGVRHRRPLVAEAVAGRPRHGAGRLRPDLEQAALVDARERAAAGPDLGDVDGRHLQHVAAGLDEAARRGDAVAELVFRRHAGPAVLDDHGLGRGAAHVEHDEVRARRAPRPAAPRRSRRRPGPTPPRTPASRTPSPPPACRRWR